MVRMQPLGLRRTDRRRRRTALGRVAIAIGLATAALSCRSSASPRAEPGENCTDRPATIVRIPQSAPATAFRVLVFTRHLGFAHASIAIGVEAVSVLGTATGFAVDATEDPSRFTDAGLAPYRVVIFLNTTGDVLDDAQQAAMERFLAAGNGWVGIHAAADTEYDWAWYQGLFGARFTGHSAIQTATIVVADSANASTRRLAPSLSRLDEWYDFASQPAAGARILVRVDEGSYSGGHMGAVHPVTWLRSYAGGRAWFTAMGHTSCAYVERPFLEHIRGGILWAAGMDDMPVAPL